MPIKHQDESYRNRGGERYVCWNDELSEHHRSEAKKAVAEMRAENVRAFAEHNDDEGYSRIFIHEKDAQARGWLSPAPVEDVEVFGL
jgi:hypothetical protein